jgi:predicted phosphodiesterase
MGKSLLLGMKPDKRLVFGHTHDPFITNDKTVVNAGSWVNELPKKEDQNSYVEITKEKLNLNILNIKPQKNPFQKKRTQYG